MCAQDLLKFRINALLMNGWRIELLGNSKDKILNEEIGVEMVIKINVLDIIEV